LSDATAAEFIDGFTGYAVVTFPSITLRVVESDPADDRVVEAAVSGRADYVVSGDTDLLGLRTYQGISIVTPARFTAILTDNE
jgi:predicted nucleic acid-binding protein